MQLTATQHLVCSAYRPPGTPPFDPLWRSETAMALARGIVADEAFDRLPILADALEEAGCDCPNVLLHCRQCREHTPLCWVLGDLFDRPPLPEPVRLTDDQVRREVEWVTGQPLATPSAPRFGGARDLFRVSWKWALLVIALGVCMRFTWLLVPRMSYQSFQHVAPPRPAGPHR